MNVPIPATSPSTLARRSDRLYEYEIVRLGEYGGSAVFGVQDKFRNSYEQVVHEHAHDGWRLVQIFAPGTAAFGAARYFELIFEREQAAV